MSDHTCTTISSTAGSIEPGDILGTTWFFSESALPAMLIFIFVKCTKFSGPIIEKNAVDFLRMPRFMLVDDYANIYTAVHTFQETIYCAYKTEPPF